jgi:hypothetical protein
LSTQKHSSLFLPGGQQHFLYSSLSSSFSAFLRRAHIHCSKKKGKFQRIRFKVKVHEERLLHLIQRGLEKEQARMIFLQWQGRV